MTESVDVDGTTLTQRVVLVGLASLQDEAPAHTAEVRRACADALDAVEGDVVGTLTEAEVSRALKELEADALVEASRDETTATGKGRPRYDLAVDRDAALSALAGDERVRGLVERVSS